MKNVARPILAATIAIALFTGCNITPAPTPTPPAPPAPVAPPTPPAPVTPPVTPPAPTLTIPIPNDFTTVDGPGGGATTFNGISNPGAVVGFTSLNGKNANFVRSAGGQFTAVDIGDPAAGMINGVNTAGSIVGIANGNGFKIIAGGTQKAITPPGSSASVAFGINDLGVIVGQYTAGATSPGFVDINGMFTPINPTAKAMVTNAQGINTAGLVIGFYSEDGMHQHGFTNDIQTQKIALLPDPSTDRIKADGLFLTQFLGINDNGEAVGYYQTNNGSQFGFLFDLKAQQYVFLDAPKAALVNGVQITQITGVSNFGQISGFYIDAGGVQHGFVASKD